MAISLEIVNCQLGSYEHTMFESRFPQVSDDDAAKHWAQRESEPFVGHYHPTWTEQPWGYARSYGTIAVNLIKSRLAYMRALGK